MSESGRVITLSSVPRRPEFPSVRQHLTTLLVRHALINSYVRFKEANRPYPFVEATHLVPGQAVRSIERSFQNTALVFAVDGMLPVSLNKHFRLRSSNRVTWRNIQRLAPDLDLSEYKATDNRFDSPGFDPLLTKLLPLDYALLVQRGDEEAGDGFQLSHLHVKVERLADNAIKDLGRKLGYIDRRLFERGEDFVEMLESKFYEYHGFSWNASGRKSAAAMAAQLFADESLCFAVFVASQEENRLTVLDDTDLVSQYLLVRLDARQRAAFRATLHEAGIADASAYLVSDAGERSPVLILRTQLRRTRAALTVKRSHRDREVLAPWLELVGEHLLPCHDHSVPELVFPWSTLQPE